MSKYDFELDLSLNTSTGRILDKIKKNSKVLEFGCAEGRMTRYMKEELSCEVYICEYNKEAFKKALKYAKDGVCGDILNFEWLEKFKDVRFDAVLFVDVLEHLTDSLGALTNAGKLLADDGEVLISIPNVTHNDILLKEISELFDYTSTGLLDDTHVHFWARENIAAFVESAGLKVRCIEGTYQATGLTEQLCEESIERYSPYLVNLLKERDCGEIYQFIITCAKQDCDSIGKISDLTRKANTINSALYIDRGNGFDTNDIQNVISVFCEPGVYQADITLEDVTGIQEIRFDPVEKQPCIILDAVAMQGTNKLNIVYPRHVSDGKGILIYGNDPMMVIPFESDLSPVSLSVKFMILSDRFTEYLNKLAFELFDERNTINDLLDKYRELIKVKDLYILEQRTDIEKKDDQINNLNGEITVRDSRITGLNEEIAGKEAKINDLTNEIADRKSELEDKELEIKRLSADLDHYRNLFVIRVRGFFGRVLRKIKRIFGGNK